MLFLCIYMFLGKTLYSDSQYLSPPRVWVYLLDASRHTNLPRFQGVRPDHVGVEISSCCFTREFVSFVHPCELVSFDPWDMTCSEFSFNNLLKNALELGGITKYTYISHCHYQIQTCIPAWINYEQIIDSLIESMGTP